MTTQQKTRKTAPKKAVASKTKKDALPQPLLKMADLPGIGEILDKQEQNLNFLFSSNMAIRAQIENMIMAISNKNSTYEELLMKLDKKLTLSHARMDVLEAEIHRLLCRKDN